MTEKKKFYGWNDRILHVDLSKNKINERPLTKELATGFIGGAGLNAKLLYDLVNPQVDPISPENLLIFGFGPVVGTTFPSSPRFTVTSKSPLTGIFGDSNAGGFFGPTTKRAGYDHIIIKGQAKQPVYLLIQEGEQPRLIDATDLWGLDTYQTDIELKRRHVNCETARIGPAGENLVKYANIISSRTRTSANGRTGMGCIMGAKKLKAIVVEAQRKIEVADERKFNELRDKYNEILKESITCKSHATYGTLQLLSMNRYSVYAKNEQTPLPEEMDILEDTFTEKFKVGHSACWMCPIGCSQKWEIKEGRFKNEKGEKVEFGHLVSLSWNLGLYDFPAALYLSGMTNRLGIDCLQLGWTLSFAMECWQRGILKREDTDGLSLDWGNFDAIREMIERVVYRKGFGSILAEGTRKAAQIIGHNAEEYAQHTKGLSFPYNADHILAMALANVVSVRGADHLKGHPISGLIQNRELLEKIFGSDLPEELFDRNSPVGKGRIVWWHENYRILQDSIGLCFIPYTDLILVGDPYVFPQEFAEILNAVTGLDLNGYQLMLIAERLVQIEKAFNALLGISRKDDTHKGHLRPNSIDNLNQPGMLDEYYQYRGLSKEGLPTTQRLREVGLEKIAKDLMNLGKISSADVPDLQKLLKKIHQHQTKNVVVTVKLHSMIRDIVGRNFLVVELGEKATVGDLIKKISEAYSDLEKQLKTSAIFRIEEKQLKLEDELHRGDTLSILMPVAGGLTSGFLNVYQK